MQIAHISDLHIVADTGPVGLVRPDAVARARALIRDLSAFRPKLDLVVITGDTANDARPDEYAELANLLADLPIPYIVIPGNHDDRHLLRQIAGEQAYADADLMYHKRDCGQARIFALDTLSQGEIGGRLLPPQLDWLAQEIGNPFEGHTFVAMHHPPCAPRMGRLDKAILLEGQDALRSILDAQPQTVTVLCGHMHRPFSAFFGRSLVSAATSTAFQFELQLDAQHEPPTSAAPYHYVIHVIDAQGGHVMHRQTPALS